jgi:hypothetical protein
MDSALLPIILTLPDHLYRSYRLLVETAAPDPRWHDVESLAAGIIALSAQVDSASVTDEMVNLVEIYIDNDREDRKIAEEVARFFSEDQVRDQLTRRNIELMTYLPEESDALSPDYNEVRRRRVARCNGAVIVYSRVPEEAVVSKVKDMVKVAAQQRRRRFRIAVHDGPPPKGFGLKHPGIRVIKRTEDHVYLENLVEFVIDAAGVA